MTTPLDRQALAADFVLGVLDAPAAAEAERLMRTDAAFARDVARWRGRLLDFDVSADSVPPSPGLWQRIESGLARAPDAAAQESAATRWWNSLTAWRAMALVSSAAALMLAVALGFAVREAQRTPAMIALLVDGDRTGAVVHIFDDGRAVLQPLADIAVPAGRALQVWTLPSRERGPVSIGLMERARTLPLTLQGIPSPGANQLFEITLEPQSGSPTGRPTGPILFKGFTTPTL